MKTTALKTLRYAAMLLSTGLFSALIATAADDPPTPAQPEPPAGRVLSVPAARAAIQLNRERALSGGPGMNLDDKQRELLRDASRQDIDEVRKLDEKLRAAQKELMQAVLAENFDEKVVREKAEAVGKIQTDITVLRAKAFSTVAPTLKPEQREALENTRVGPTMLLGGGPGVGGPGGGFGGGGGGFGGGPGGPGGGFGGQGGGGGGFGGAGFGPGGGGGAGGGGGFRGRDGQPGQPGQPGQERPRRNQPPPPGPGQ